MADDRIDVAIGVDSGEAEAGASAASGAMLKAVQGIQSQLERLTAVSQQNSTAMTASFARMASAAQQSGSRIATSIRAAAGVVDDYGNQVAAASAKVVAGNAAEAASTEALSHSSVGARREMLVLAHELATGNFKRAAGSVMVLGERLDWMGKIMSPVGATVAAVAAEIALVATAAIEGSHQMDAFRDAMILTGNYAGITSGQFIEMGNTIANDTGAKIGTVRDALQAVAASGRFTGAALQPVAEAIAMVGQYSNQSAEDVAKSFERMSEGVYQWAANYNEQYHFATNAQLEHIRALEQQGDKEQAEAEAANLVTAKLRDVSAELDGMPGLLQRAANEWHRFWDEAEGIGRPVTIDDRINNLKEQLASAQPYSNLMPQGIQQGREQLRRLEQQRDQSEAYAGQQAQSEAIQNAGTKAVEGLRAEWKGLGGDVNLANEAVARFRKQLDDARAAAKNSGDALAPDVQAMVNNQSQIEANIRKQYDRQDFKKQPGQVTVGQDYSQDNARTQAQLNSLKESLKEQQSELDRSYKMNEVSLQSYYAQRLQITLQGMDAEADAVKQELAQTQALEGQAQNPAQRMSLMTKEIALQGRLTVMAQQRAAAVTQSDQEQLQAEEQLADQLQQLAARRAQDDLQSSDQRALMVAQRQVQQGQMTNQQLLAMEAQFNEQETAQEIQALTQRLQTEKNLSIETQQQILSQILQLQQQSQTKQLQLSLQANQQQAQQAQQATQSVEDAFSGSFAKFADGTERGKQAFGSFISQIDTQLTQLVSKDLFNKLFQMPLGSGQGSSINGMLGGAMSKLFGGGAAGTTQTAALTANTTGLTALTAQITALIAALQESIASSAGGAGGAGGGLSGMLDSIFSGGGSEAGAFGFSSGLEGSTGAVASGAMADSGSGMSALMGLASFAVGTPYVPNDMIAQIHQGEAIVPAHMNSTNSTVSVVNQFSLPGGADLRTQSQIAAMAGAGIQNALQRNG